jgi:hypothetical protein
MFGPGWRRRQAFIGGFGVGAAVICGSVVGGAIIGSDGRLVIDRISSWREVLHLDDDVFLPSNCWITLHLGTTKDLLLAWMASVTVFSHFCMGSGCVGIELAGGGHTQHELER